MPELKLYDDYSRKDVHDIFAPSASFTPQAGSWGLQGIIELPDRQNDFVLFVTFGKEQGGYEFDEGISSEGVLRWQSQPRQRMTDKTVQQLIAHDEIVSSIYLFLRTEARRQGLPSDYTYFGKLKYQWHDNQREQPVYFAWQLLSWPIPQDVMNQIGLALESGAGLEETASEEPDAVPVKLVPDETAPAQGPRVGMTTRLFPGTSSR